MTNVYFRRPNGKLGHFAIGTDDHALAIATAVEDLAEVWREPPHPVLAVVSTKRENWDG